MIIKILIFSFLSFSFFWTSGTPREKVQKMYSSVKSKFSDVEEISAQSFKSKKNDFVLVDVRDKKERDVSVIPGAMSLDNFNQNIENFKTKKVVFYCTIGHRSAVTSRKMKQKGIQAFNLAEGILGWVHEGGEVVSPSGQKVKRVHVYGWRWNQLPDGYKGTH